MLEGEEHRPDKSVRCEVHGTGSLTTGGRGAEANTPSPNDVHAECDTEVRGLDTGAAASPEGEGEEGRIWESNS